MASTVLAPTPRLQFERLRAGHAEGLFGPLSDSRVFEHIDDELPATVEALAARFAFLAAGPSRDRACERWLNYAVRICATGPLIGRLEATIVEKRVEVAYLFGPDYWGQGYAAEAMHAFQDNLRACEGITEFWATTTPQNARSIRLLQRLGYAQIFDSWPALLSYDNGDLVFVLR